MTTHARPSIQNRRTPPWLFKVCESLVPGPFVLDAFADEHNALCTQYHTEQTDGLLQRWSNCTFSNPPFKLMGLAIAKAVEELLSRGVVSCLIGPVGCSQSWFHNDVRRHATIYAPNQRISFLSATGDLTGGADRDTMIYVFEHVEPLEIFNLRVLDIKGLVQTARRGASSSP